GPAIRLSRSGLTDVLRPGGRVLGAQGKGVLRIGRSLVVGQVALSLALLIGAACFVRTLGNLLDSDLGFDRSSIIAARFDPTLAGIPRSQWPDLRARLVEAARAIPGASHAVLALNGPLSGGARISDIQIGGQPELPGNEADVREDYVGPAYFATVRTPLLTGRDFTNADDEKHPKVAIVSQAMATHFFGKANPIGQHFGYGSPADVEIVGIVADTHMDGILGELPRLVYYPLSQYPQESSRHLYVRVEGTEAASAAM